MSTAGCAELSLSVMTLLPFRKRTPARTKGCLGHLTGFLISFLHVHMYMTKHLDRGGITVTAEQQMKGDR